MRLDQITIHNFRQYTGTQKIIFSKDKDRNVTVIHGENGSGKTALLNAFSWCLYGKIDLPNPNEVINERCQLKAVDGEELSAFVKLQFSNDGRTYYVTRSISARKTGSLLEYFKPSLEVEYIDVDGRTVNPKGAQNLIDQIIPPDMRSYFFFDGERIDKMQDKEQAKDIKNAIKVVMGLEILERSVNHLEVVKKRFREESAQLGTTEQQEVDAKLKEISNLIDIKNSEKDLQEQNKAALEEEIREIQTKLRTLEESKELQQQRETLERERESVLSELKDLQKQIRHFVSKSGYLAFAGKAIDKAKEYLDEKREQNQIPTGIKQQFVDDLIQNQICICGRPIHKGSDEYTSIMGWRGKSSTKELEDAFINTTGDLKFAIQERARMFEDLHSYRNRRENLIQARFDLEAELSEVQDKLEGKDVEEIANLVKKERESRDKLEEIKDRIKRFEIELENYNKESSQLEKVFDTIQIENEKAILAKKRMDICDTLKLAFSKIYQIRSLEVQHRLQEKISDVYGRLLRKGFEVCLTENYEIEVYKVLASERKAVGLSQGERQITSLSFIGALVDIAREQLEKEKMVDAGSSMKFGGYYPIVMDSPFGQLDEDHRARVARGLPSLAHQMIIIVSSSQWKGQVNEHMKDRVGKEYTLVFHGGSEDYTEIQEVN